MDSSAKERKLFGIPCTFSRVSDEKKFCKRTIFQNLFGFYEIGYLIYNSLIQHGETVGLVGWSGGQLFCTLCNFLNLNFTIIYNIYYI